MILLTIHPCHLQPMIITGFTPLNTENCILQESRIDLWQFSLAQELYIVDQLLDEEERARMERFYFHKHKRRFSTARGMMRIILGQYLNYAPEKLQFTYNEHGKPSINNVHKLQFNLSHTGDIALLAVGKGCPLGVDIEQFSARPYAGIAKNLFSDLEFRGWQKAPNALKPILFFHVWSQKEAFIKATGLGLAYPTKDFNVPTTIPTKQLVDDPLHNMTWQLRSFMPQAGCSAALCHHPTIREIRYGIVQIQQNASLEF